MVGVGTQRFHSLQIEALHVHQALETARMEHIYQIAGNATQAKAALDALFQHHILQELGSGQRCTACAGLEGEAVLQKAGVFNNLDRMLCHHQTHRVTGDLGRTGDDALGVTDGIHIHHIIHIGFGNGEIHQRIGYQIVGDDNHLLGMHSICIGIAQAAASGLAVLAGAVTHGVRGGSGNECHINGGIPGADVAGTAAVGTELHRLFQNALGDGTTQGCRNIVGANTGDYTVCNMTLQRQVGVKQRAGIDGNLLNAQVCHLFHDHVQHKVTVAQMVVEGYGHAVLEACQLDGFPDRIYKLRHITSPFPCPGLLPWQWFALPGSQWAHRSSCRTERSHPCPVPLPERWLPEPRRHSPLPSGWD